MLIVDDALNVTCDTDSTMLIALTIPSALKLVVAPNVVLQTFSCSQLEAVNVLIGGSAILASEHPNAVSVCTTAEGARVHTGHPSNHRNIPHATLTRKPPTQKPCQ